ncbi:uncharacterized protein B0J16DRAFT_403192 [Fusarium flagelliforme]|uniref:Ipa protein n=1 Tax=Fusarium flagelliforme TaxID=2675880 RepID=A0A395MYF9_9HYPO|nr:uncharacterized protein B0J16DRAFT_403192 [Fusarium flagelliforme]KAH7179874.1 hypothetical protein B0J16DRAFT_403192 [Fusarium flagelliforme]RFN52685.1 ipa protein [Fusarium flagelliforme]
MMSQDNVVITALHRDLRRKYEKHFGTVEKVWLVSNQAKREQLFEGCSHPDYEDEEGWDLAEITEDKDLFLRMLTWRATASWSEQLNWGLSYERDADAVDQDDWDKWYDSPHYCEDTYTYLSEDDLYGETFDVDVKLMDDCNSWGQSDKLQRQVNSSTIIPHRLAGPVIRRQVNFFYCLNALVDKILDTEKARCLEKRARYAEEDRTPTLQGLIDSARGYKTYYKTSLYRLHTDTRFLYKCVKDQLISRPDRIHQLEESEHEYQTGSIGRDIFDAAYTKVRSLAFWRSVCELLNLANSSSDNQRFLHEIHQLCDQQCDIAKQNVRRHIAMGIAKGRFSFSVPHWCFIEIYRGEWILKDVHIHYLTDLVTRVQGPDMTICQLRKLDEFYKRKPEERERLSERESEALHELCTILAVFQDFKKVFPQAEGYQDFETMGNIIFKYGLQYLDRDVQLLRRIHFPHICDININDLDDPFTVSLAVDELRVYVKRHLGTSLGNLYRDQVFDMIEAVQSPELLRFPNILEPSFEKRFRARRVREARRLLLPPNPSNGAATGPSSAAADGGRIAGGRTRIARSEIAETLLRLFDKDLNGVCRDMN